MKQYEFGYLFRAQRRGATLAGVCRESEVAMAAGYMTLKREAAPRAARGEAGRGACESGAGGGGAGGGPGLATHGGVRGGRGGQRRSTLEAVQTQCQACESAVHGVLQ